MRGKVAQFPPDYFQTRITPAYAGKSHQQSGKCYSSGGSPPPMRGKDKKEVLL